MKRPRVNRQAVVGTVLEYVWMIFGMFIYSFGWLACIMPANTLGGGAAGLSLLFYHITGLPIGMLTLIVNGVLLLIGGTIVGWNFGMKTIFCIAMLSVTMSVLQPLLAAVTPAGQTLFALDPVSDRILLVILGGIIAGIGIAICFRQGGSTGGTDIIAMIVNKYKTISYGRIVMTVDSMIILSSLFVGDMGVDSVIYGFVVTAVLGYTVDVIQAGNQQSSQIFVFTRRYEAMADQIIGQYETMKAQSDAPVFLHAVTMQNHTNYNKDNYPDDQRVKVTEAPAGLKASTVGALEDFATGIRDADAMLGRLTAYFSDREEPVVLVFYGDHLPYLGDNQKGYAELGSEVSIPENEREDILCSYKTPYVLWANDAAADTLNWNEAVAALDFPEDGVLSAAFLGSVLLDLTGRAGESPWFDFLSSVRRLVPVVQKKTYILADGSVLPQRILNEQTDESSMELKDAVRKWRCWSYYKLKYAEVG